VWALSSNMNAAKKKKKKKKKKEKKLVRYGSSGRVLP
jgi:hypothetical protein